MGLLVQQRYAELAFQFKKFLRPWNKVLDELCAPAVGVIGDTMIVFGSTYSKALRSG